MIRDSSIVPSTRFVGRGGLPCPGVRYLLKPPHGALEEQMNRYTKYVRSVSDCSSVLYIDVSPKDSSLGTMKNVHVEVGIFRWYNDRPTACT